LEETNVLLEVGVNIKFGREIDVVLSSSFLIEGAGKEKLSPAVLSLKSNSQCQIVIRRDVSGVRERHNGHFCYCHVYSTFGSHGTDLFRIEIYADQMCHVNAAS
jgi:hypothetical protein